MINKYLKISFWYNFFTNKFYRFLTIFLIIGFVVWSYYSWFYNKNNKGDIKIKHYQETYKLKGKEVEKYMERNGFKFIGGNPVYATNFTLINDGVDFRRYINNDKTIKYQYCNTNVYPKCINTDITINELPNFYDSENSSYSTALEIYNDYQKKLYQLNLTHEQIKSALDYYYQEIYGE